MITLPISQAREKLPELGDRACHRGERIVVQRRGKNLFAIIPVEDLELLERMEDKMDLELIRERENEPRISLATLRKELGL